MNEYKLSPEFCRYIVIAPLRELATTFSASVYLRHGSDYRIYISSYYEGKRNSSLHYVKKAKDQCFFHMDSDEIYQYLDPKSDLYIIHFIPESFYQDDQLTRDFITIQDFQKHGVVSDAFVEYGDEYGPSMCVGYHSMLWNIPTRKEQTSIFQGCKCLVGPNHRTRMLFIHFSADPEYNKIGLGNIKVFSELGNVLQDKNFQIQANSALLIDVGETIPAEKEACYNFIGASANSTLLPFVIVENTKAGSFFIEHGIPPNAYAHGYSPQHKLNSALAVLKRSESTQLSQEGSYVY